MFQKEMNKQSNGAYFRQLSSLLPLKTYVPGTYAEGTKRLYFENDNHITMVTDVI